MVSELVELRLRSRYDDLAVRLPLLLPELHRAHLQYRSTASAGLLIQAYRAADAIADKYDVPDLSARIIDAMRHQAAHSRDPLDAATVAYVRAEVFMASGDLGSGRRMLEQAIATHRSPSGTAQVAAVGALHMRCAILAARDADSGDAIQHLDAAERHASRVPDGVYNGTAFGSSSVRIHRLSAALDSGDAASGAKVGIGWHPGSAVPPERRSHFHIDLARAHLELGRPDESISSLYQALDVAPEHTRHHALVHATVAKLIAREPNPGQDLLTLGRTVGVTVASSRQWTQQVG